MNLRAHIVSPAVARGLAVLCAALFIASTPSTARAGGVVGTGSAASCTDAALNTALAGGGLVTFNCGGPATIDISTGTGTKGIAADTTIDGGGTVTISGGNSVGVFHVNTGITFTVQNLTIANGASVIGGGINNTGTLTVTNSTFSGNSASGGPEQGYGGGIYNTGTLTVTNSTFSGNSASHCAIYCFPGGSAITNDGGTLTVTNCTFSDNSGDGGAVATFSQATVTVTNSLFSGNSGGGIQNDGPLTVINSTFSGNTLGGGINAVGPLTLANSTFSGNSAGDAGGAIYARGGVVTNSTFSGNSAGAGGAIYAGGPLTVTNSTLSGNSAHDGGGISNPYSHPVTITNTIVANNTSGGNCYGTITDGGHNIDDGTTCGFTGTGCTSTSGSSFCSTNPQLNPAGLAKNGGPTQTIALEPGSPAVNAGDESVCAGPPVNNRDQRGFVRPGAGHMNCSIGAYEADATAPCVVGTGTSASCTESALDACLPGGAGFNGAVTFDCGGAATITVTSSKTISADTTIDGGGMVTISGGNSVGVFSVNAGVKFTIQNLTIASGHQVQSSTGGGAIGNAGSLTVTNCTFSNNSVFGFFGAAGGAIYNSGALTATGSTFLGNNAEEHDGGGSGGAIYNSGTLTVTNCTFDGNGGGGAISNRGTLSVTNSTFSGNSADGSAAAIDNATNCGGTSNAPCAATLSNTIVANNTFPDCNGTITDAGHNLDDGTTCGFSTANGSLSNTDPKLDPAGLKDNGGPTQTIALQAGSPAINAGDETVCAAPPVNNLDQRGHVRPGDGATSCSIGAYEWSGLPTPSPTLTPTVTFTPTPTPEAPPSVTRTPTPTGTAMSTLTPVPTDTPTRTPALCVGDCGGTHTVALDNLITLVNIALGTALPSACPDGIPSGADVNIALLIQAVNNALNGCGNIS